MIRIQDVQRIVARHYGLEPGYMTSAERSRCYSRPRQVAMYLARELTGHSTTVIGHWFNRDHSTIVHGSQVVQRLCAQDVSFSADIALLEAKISVDVKGGGFSPFPWKPPQSVHNLSTMTTLRCRLRTERSQKHRIIDDPPHLSRR